MRLAFPVITLLILAGCSNLPPVNPTSSIDAGHNQRLGALVMAHGGDRHWNSSVEEAIGLLDEEMPVSVAYGMADPSSLRTGLKSLLSEGVTHVAVVRLFLSGDSFLDQTKFLLGLSGTPPESWVLMGPGASNPEARQKIQHTQVVATHLNGLIQSEYAGKIMLERAASLSLSPSEESVLIIAHGMGDEDENNKLLESMRGAAERVAQGGYADVQIATLREDWPSKRITAEQEIQRYVSEENESGRRVLVLPMRLSGFGPYREVLAGLNYSEGLALLPHEEIARWILETAYDVSFSSGWNFRGVLK
jgi:hypothetical protein